MTIITIDITLADQATLREFAQPGETMQQHAERAIAERAARLRGHETARREFVAALEDAYGVIPGGD